MTAVKRILTIFLIICLQNYLDLNTKCILKQIINIKNLPSDLHIRTIVQIKIRELSASGQHNIPYLVQTLVDSSLWLCLHPTLSLSQSPYFISLFFFLIVVILKPVKYLSLYIEVTAYSVAPILKPCAGPYVQ